MTAPLRFLASVIGLWCLGRAGVLLWPVAGESGLAASGAPVVSPPASRAAELDAPSVWLAERPTDLPLGKGPEQRSSVAAVVARNAGYAFPGPRSVGRDLVALAAFGSGPASKAEPIDAGLSGSRPGLPGVALPTASTPPPSATIPRLSPGPPLSRTASGKPSVAAWVLWRPGEAAAAPSGIGTLGGAQAGVRVTAAIAPERMPGVSLAARVSAPLRRRGAEAAVGLEWRPDDGLPVRLLAERRQRLSGEGRSAFALLAHGGVNDLPLGRGWRLDAYGAAGVVGARSRDLFAEGAATATRPLGPVLVGAGAWGGAQTGAARLDAGPTVAARLPLGAATARVSLDYRVRVAGNAAPGTGPALTFGTGF